mgnify:CR=1 FL=1
MISHSNITEQIIQYFKENINSGNWTVGERIPSENQLRETLGVSRASIRTAIQHLVGIGVLESRQGKGTFLLDDQVDERPEGEMKITSEDCKNIEKVLEFRRIVESEASYLAAQNRTDQLVKNLWKHLKNMSENEGRRDRFVTADIAFHEEICKASQNPLLEKTLLKVFEETRKNHNQMNELFGYRDGIYYHTLISTAIANGDAMKAKELMYEHLQNAINKIEDTEKMHNNNVR